MITGIQYLSLLLHCLLFTGKLIGKKPLVIFFTEIPVINLDFLIFNLVFVSLKLVDIFLAQGV